MTSPEPDFDALVDALRNDLPSETDERRVRRRLLAAGVAVAAGVVAPGAAAAGMAGGASLPVALVHKLGALSWVTKLGLAGIAATAAVPAVKWATEPLQHPVVDEAPPVRSVVPRSLSRAPAPPADLSERIEVSATESNAEPEQAPAERARVTAQHEPSRADAPEVPLTRPSTASFPVEEREEARAASTLRAETALIERALFALRVGDRAGARRTLAEHGRLYPNGALAPERDRALARANALDDPNGPAAP